jgi:hypothetical protein
MTLIVLNQPPHEVILCCQQLSRLTGEQGGGGGAVPREAWPCPHPVDPLGMSMIESSEVLVRTI